jgi:hypothetical protein
MVRYHWPTDQELRHTVARAAPLPEIEITLREATRSWMEGFIVRLYDDDAVGLELQGTESRVIEAHGYIVHSSDAVLIPVPEARPVHSILVGYARREKAHAYQGLRYPGMLTRREAP